MAPKLHLVPPPTQATGGGEPATAPAPAKKPPALTAKQNGLVKLGLPLLERLVAAFVRRYRDVVTEEGVYGAGAIALHEAALRFEEGRHASFIYYATCHIRHALTDVLRAERLSLRARVERSMERAFCSFSGHQILDVDLFADPKEKLEEGMRKGGADVVAAAFIASMMEGRAATAEEEMIELEGLRERLEVLEEALGTLYPAEREVIRMVYDEEMQLKQIAGKLGVHENTAQNRHTKALRKLRKIMLGRET
jgi:RNA polymerase sigma factor for flagellar operon FliA